MQLAFFWGIGSDLKRCTWEALEITCVCAVYGAARSWCCQPSKRRVTAGRVKRRTGKIWLHSAPMKCSPSHNCPSNEVNDGKTAREEMPRTGSRQRGIAVTSVHSCPQQQIVAPASSAELVAIW